MKKLSDYEYCPYDGQRLTTTGGLAEARASCPRCGFVDYQNPKTCVAILIVQDNEVLLARRRVEPAKGEWDIPGGAKTPPHSALSIRLFKD